MFQELTSMNGPERETLEDLMNEEDEDDDDDEEGGADGEEPVLEATMEGSEDEDVAGELQQMSIEQRFGLFYHLLMPVLQQRN
jgi:hypothetical protein